MNAQQRTLDDLKTGVNVQIDKSGNIRFRMQPQMGLPSIELIDKAEVTKLEKVMRAAYAYDYCNDDDVERKRFHLRKMREALKEVGHLI